MLYLVNGIGPTIVRSLVGGKLVWSGIDGYLAEILKIVIMASSGSSSYIFLGGSGRSSKKNVFYLLAQGSDLQR
jgi:hypothetical protein